MKNGFTRERWNGGGGRGAREFDGGLFAAPKPDVGVPHLRKNSYQHKENKRSGVGAGALQDLDSAVFRRSDCNILAENNCLSLGGHERGNNITRGVGGYSGAVTLIALE